MDDLMETIVGYAFSILLVAAVGLIIYAIITAKEKKAGNTLSRNLAKNGFISTYSLEVSDGLNPGKPVTFMVDWNKKLWVAAEYRAVLANPYAFSDLDDYVVIYREKSNTMLKGNEVRITVSSVMSGGRSIMEAQNLSEDNCEYIEIRMVCKGTAAAEHVHTQYVLYEEQELHAVQNIEFVASRACVENAKKFEKLLYLIIKANLSS